MNIVFLLSFVLGTLEVFLITFLTYQTYTNGGWWGLGLLIYLIFCIVIGAGPKSIMTLGMTGLFITLAYIQYGLIGAFGMYVLIIAATELLPKLMGRLPKRQ